MAVTTWEPSDSSLRNSLRILGNLPKEYFYLVTLRLDPYFGRVYG